MLRFHECTSSPSEVKKNAVSASVLYQAPRGTFFARLLLKTQPTVITVLSETSQQWKHMNLSKEGGSLNRFGTVEDGDHRRVKKRTEHGAARDIQSIQPGLLRSQLLIHLGPSRSGDRS